MCLPAGNENPDRSVDKPTDRKTELLGPPTYHSTDSVMTGIACGGQKTAGNHKVFINWKPAPLSDHIE